MATIPEQSTATPGASTALADASALVIGASRGLGRGVAQALAAEGAAVVAVGRDTNALAEVESDRIAVVAGDATDHALAESLLAEHDPDILVVVAGGHPVLRPLQDHDWETFSTNWNSDTRIAFEFVAQALRQPLRPNSTVVTFSSGAALVGSPLSGGYAAANAGVRFLTDYAAEESDRLGLGLRFTTVLPKLTDATGLGRAAVEAYAQRDGIPVEDHVENMGHLLTPEGAGQAIVELATTPEPPPASLLTAEGLQPVPR